jgi:hypothetical protein
MKQYNYVKKIIEDNECALITTFEDFELRRESVLDKSYLYVRVDFIGICGHNSSAVFTNFKSRGTGKRCKECVKKETNNTLKKNVNLMSHITEYKSVELITKYLSSYYDIERTNECCRADLAIKEKGKDTDEWIPVQVKSTDKLCHKMYSFRGLKEEYKDMLLICVCNSEEKIWVIPYNELKINCSTLNISEYSKYNEYGCGNNLILYHYIDLHKDKCMRQQLDECLLPLGDLQKREQEYVKKRVKYIEFLKFESLSLQNTPTDFIVNGKRVQEKVCGYDNVKPCLVAHLASNNGKKENGTRKFRTYKLGENDYYWLNSSIDDRFWIIPENILYDMGYISDKDTTKKNTVLRIRVNKENNYGVREWIKEYEYNYNNPNKEKIMKLFE